MCGFPSGYCAAGSCLLKRPVKLCGLHCTVIGVTLAAFLGSAASLTCFSSSSS